MTSKRNSSPPSRPGPPDQGADADRAQALLDAVPAPLEPLDAGALDGFLCGVLLQPVKLPPSRWLRWVADAEGRMVPADFDAGPLHALALARHRVLALAIGRRQWFDPWVFELDEESSPSQAVASWVAGFALAIDTFPGLMQLDASALTEPLALLYRHLDPDDLEDADELLAEIDLLEPPLDLTEAVEDLVSATLSLADVSQPIVAPPKGVGRPATRPRRR